MATLLPNGKQRYSTSTGAPLVGGKLHTYDQGTSTPRATYSDVGATTPNTNPVILDANGEATVFWSGAYKVVLTDSADVVQWTVDGVVSADTYADDSETSIRADLASTAGATKGAGLSGFGASLAYPAGTVGGKLRQFRTFKDFGAVGDGIADDSDAIEAALLSNADVYDDTRGSTYRITRQINIPNSCFTRLRGAGNVPVPASKFFVDFSGAAFKGGAGDTSFYCFENFYCYSTASHAAAQFIDDDGDLVHGHLKRLVLRNFKGKAIDLNSAFRCEIDVLIEYCWDYGVTIGAGSATRLKFTADHSYAGGVDIGVNTSGFIIEPYTEAICSDNDPAGADASWREMKIRGGLHTVLGGVLNVHPLNNKYPIDLTTARAITFIGVRGFSLGAAPYWINLDSTDSSATVIDCPDITFGGTTTNLMVLDGGYTTTKPDVTISGQSMRNTTSRVWAVIDGATGSLLQGQGVTASSRTGTGTYRLTWPAGTFANTNYSVALSCDAPAVVGLRYTGKADGQVDITSNKTDTSALEDVYTLSVELTGV